MNNISLIFPAFNEEENIRKLLDQALIVAGKLNIPYEIIIVNDGSTDLTANIVNTYINLHPENIKLITHEANKGYGATLKDGFNNARYEWIFFADSDLQFNLDEINNLIKHIGIADLIIGYRKNRQDHLYRKVNAFLFKIAVRTLFDIKAKDIDCAFKLIKKNVLENIKLITNGALINTELLYKSVKKNYKIIEVPVNHYPRIAGKPTGANVLVVLRAIKELAMLRILS